eukprot:1070469-Prorocentrum_minimum.AAC.1
MDPKVSKKNLKPSRPPPAPLPPHVGGMKNPRGTMWTIQALDAAPQRAIRRPRFVQVCAARNVHGRTLPEVEALAAEWEPAPPTYTRLDAASLFHDLDETAPMQEITE